MYSGQSSFNCTQRSDSRSSTVKLHRAQHIHETFSRPTVDMCNVCRAEECAGGVEILECPPIRREEEGGLPTSTPCIDQRATREPTSGSRALWQIGMNKNRHARTSWYELRHWTGALACFRLIVVDCSRLKHRGWYDVVADSSVPHRACAAASMSKPHLM